MGYELARAAVRGGHRVTLIAAPTEQRAAEGVKVIRVESACDMFEEVKSRFGRCDCLIMAAAVADYTPIKAIPLKMRKSYRAITLKLKPTPDILKWAGNHKKQDQVVIGFALEDNNIKAGAKRKLREKNLDMIVANTPAAIGADKSSVWIKTNCDDWQVVKNETKGEIAGKIIRLAEKFIRCSKEGRRRE
jgi:phosphopantothenoylcysteine decarboxylase/phosphopantothenate--cysteine ligase